MIAALSSFLMVATALGGEGIRRSLSEERERESMAEYGHEFGFSEGVVFVDPGNTSIDASRGACSLEWGREGALMTWASRYKTGPKARRHQSSLKAYELLTQKLCRRDPREEIRILEIGVQSGGCIHMWRWFFGLSRVRYVGIDINPLSAAWADEKAHIYLGSVQKPGLLEKIVRQHGPFDLIVDDGARKSVLMDASFDALYPRALADDGLFCIEDLNSVYRKETTAANAWLQEDFKAEGLERSFVGRSKSFVDALHTRRQREPDEEEDKEIFQDAWQKSRTFAYRTEAVHFYESMVCLQRMPETERLEVYEAGDFRLPFMWNKGSAGNSEIVSKEGTRRTIREIRKKLRNAPDGSGLRPEHLSEALHLSPDPLERTQWNSNDYWSQAMETDPIVHGGGFTRFSRHRHRPHSLQGTGGNWHPRTGSLDN